ncbi:MAG: hypothetical protein DRJ42_25020 [Deltaproteobacteria bacterium]|nr:MAG: hypothetical protein DRJ42_25020 [Deltaproteobacteria bacterium]
MPSLEEALASDDKKQIVIEDCLVLLDQEVADKKGLSGIAIKTGFKAVKSIKPGFIRGVVSDLIPEFAQALDPMFQEANEGGRGVGEHFVTHSSAAADALLSITDKKAVKSKNRVVKGTYQKLRGQAKKSVEAAMPRLGKMIEKHTAS